MRLRSIVSLLLCLSLICLSFGFVSAAYANPDTNNDSETNVITASDAGGGNITQRELLWIILGVAVLILLIVALS